MAIVPSGDQRFQDCERRPVRGGVSLEDARWRTERRWNVEQLAHVAPILTPDEPGEVLRRSRFERGCRQRVKTRYDDDLLLPGRIVVSAGKRPEGVQCKVEADRERRSGDEEVGGRTQLERAGVPWLLRGSCSYGEQDG